MDNPIERKIVRDLAALLIGAGMPVTVDHPDEESHELEASTDLDAIEAAAFEFVDGIWLLTNKADNGKYDSWIRVVFGREAECVSNYSTDLQAVIQPVLDWCENPRFADADFAWRSENEKAARVRRALQAVFEETGVEALATIARMDRSHLSTLYDLLHRHDTAAGAIAEIAAPGL